MIKKTKHYRCKSCRNVAVVKQGKESPPVRCPKCNTLIDEHDEIVRLVRPMIRPAIRVH